MMIYAKTNLNRKYFYHRQNTKSSGDKARLDLDANSPRTNSNLFIYSIFQKSQSCRSIRFFKHTAVRHPRITWSIDIIFLSIIVIHSDKSSI